MSGLLSWERIGVEGRAVSSAGIKDYQTKNDGHESLAAVMKMMNSTEETLSISAAIFPRSQPLSHFLPGRHALPHFPKHTLSDGHDYINNNHTVAVLP